MKQPNSDIVNPFRNIYFKFVFASGGRAPNEIVHRHPAIAMAPSPWSNNAVRQRGERFDISSQPRPEARNTLASVNPVFVRLLQAPPLRKAVKPLRNNDFRVSRQKLDSSTPLGRAMFTIIAAMAELERSVI